MGTSLAEILDELLRKAVSTTEGRETLMRYDHTINFDVLDGEPFHIEIIGGEVDINCTEAPPRPISEAYNIRGKEAAFRDWFEGSARFSDLIHEHRMYPQAAHTTKRHVDNWIVKLVRLGQRKHGLKDMY